MCTCGNKCCRGLAQPHMRLLRCFSSLPAPDHSAPNLSQSQRTSLLSELGPERPVSSWLTQGAKTVFLDTSLFAHLLNTIQGKELELPQESYDQAGVESTGRDGVILGFLRSHTGHWAPDRVITMPILQAKTLTQEVICPGPCGEVAGPQLVSGWHWCLHLLEPPAEVLLPTRRSYPSLSS